MRNPTRENSVRLEIPRPYPLQQEIIDHPALRKVVCAGRRAGKTHVATVAAIKAFLGGNRVLLSSTSQDQADVFWRYLKRWTRPLFDAAYKNETKRILSLGEGEIRVKTGSNSDALRGDNVNLLVLDECARLDPTAWQEVGAPMLADTGGAALFISTPLRRNWFFELYQRGIDPEESDWAAWQFPTTANPFLNSAAVARLAQDMTAEAYAQEIEAQFLEGAGALFRNVQECCTANRAQPYAGKFVIGIDFAQSHDFTVCAVLDINARRMVDMERFNRLPWADQRTRIEALAARWKPTRIVAERNSAGGPVVEELMRVLPQLEAFDTTGQTKPPLIQSLQLAFERREITALNDPVLKGELMAYEAHWSATGRPQYSAPEGMHDDTVISLALAWYALTAKTRPMSVGVTKWL
jgi:hypothetical protein